jgi:DNA mismatch repair protein MutS
VVRDAKRRLVQLENAQAAAGNQPDLFAAPLLEAATEAEPHPALEALADLDPDALTPREALDRLYALKGMLQ